MKCIIGGIMMRRDGLGVSVLPIEFFERVSFPEGFCSGFSGGRDEAGMLLTRGRLHPRARSDEDGVDFIHSRTAHGHVD